MVASGNHKFARHAIRDQGLEIRSAKSARLADGESHVVAGTRKYVPTLGRVLRYLGKVVRFI
jgi:hypothetical protein